jgi:hypothetical protein
VILIANKKRVIKKDPQVVKLVTIRYTDSASRLQAVKATERNCVEEKVIEKRKVKDVINEKQTMGYVAVCVHLAVFT